MSAPTDPVPGFRSGYVALAGAPNAGKSTLMNRLVRCRLAIVSPKPQTTRRRTLGILTGESYQAILLDTPGIVDPRYPLQEAMMRTVGQVLADADVVCFLCDAQQTRPERLQIPERVAAFGGPRVAALNKIDLVRPRDLLLPLLDALGAAGLFDEIVPISALEGEGVDTLLDLLVRRLPEGPPFYPADQLTEQPERFFVSELIREQVYTRFAQEIPYAVEVEVTDFRERPGGKEFIEAVLYVEQESQKGILVGRGGHAIRGIGAAAREAIEQFLGRPVYLELRVKELPRWRRDRRALRRLGYRI